MAIRLPGGDRGDDRGRVIRLDRGDETARFDLTSSTREFARRTREIVDSKLTLSATLMRAGEVDEAKRLLAEVERDVRVEQAALSERVNELRFARPSQDVDPPLTRGRVVRMLAVACLGAVVSTISVGGVMLARGGNTIAPLAPAERAPVFAGSSSGPVDAEDPKRGVIFVEINGRRVALTPAQYKAYQDAIQNGGGSANDLELLLQYSGVDLPSVDEVVDGVNKAAGDAAGTVGSAGGSTGSGSSGGTNGGSSGGGTTSGGSTQTSGQSGGSTSDGTQDDPDDAGTSSQQSPPPVDTDVGGVGGIGG